MPLPARTTRPSGPARSGGAARTHGPGPRRRESAERSPRGAERPGHAPDGGTTGPAPRKDPAAAPSGAPSSAFVPSFEGPFPGPAPPHVHACLPPVLATGRTRAEARSALYARSPGAGQRHHCSHSDVAPPRDAGEVAGTPSSGRVTALGLR